MEIMKETPWSRGQGTKPRGQRILGDCWQWESNGQCCEGDNCSFRHDVNKRAKLTQPNPSPNSFMQQNERNASRTRSPRGKSPSGRLSRLALRGLLQRNLHQITLWKVAPSRMFVLQDQEWLSVWGKVLMSHIVRLMNSLAKRSKKNGDKSAVAMLKKHGLYDRTGKPVVCRDTCHERHGPVVCNSSNTRQLGCIFQDMEPPKFSSILRKSSDMQKPIQRVKFTKVVARHAYIRDQNPSLGMICPGEPHERSSKAPWFEGRSQEETEWQERGAREAAWKLAKSVLKWKEKNKATFFSPSENRCLPASTLKLEEREFVVDSGASMHMISTKDLNDAEMVTLTTSKKSDDGFYSQWWSADAWRGYSVCQRIGYILDYESPRKHASSLIARKSFAMKTDILMNGSTVKNHISKKKGFGYNATRRTSFRSWFQACHRVLPPILIPQPPWHLQDRRGIVLHLLQARLLHRQQHQVYSETREREDQSEIDSPPVPVSSLNVDDRTEKPVVCRETNHEHSQANQKSPKKNKEETTIERRDPSCAEIPEWLQEFRENSVDDEIPEHGDSYASSSHGASLEPTSKRSEDWGKQSVYTHFPKDRNCEICKRTKITRAPCRRRNGGAVPRAEIFVTWKQQTTRSSAIIVNLETITDMQSWCRI